MLLPPARNEVPPFVASCQPCESCMQRLIRPPCCTIYGASRQEVSLSMPTVLFICHMQQASIQCVLLMASLTFAATGLANQAR
jgi:hypothetical protein